MTRSCLTLTRLMTLPVVALGALVLGGCQNDEGGMGYSAGQEVFVSRTWMPWTITLRDTRTGQEMWSIDVPVGKKLVMDFDEGDGTKDDYTPDLLNWAIVDEDGEFPALSNHLPVPPSTARRIETTLRTAPELAESMVRVTRGTLKPAEVQRSRPPTVAVPAPRPSEPMDEPAPVPQVGAPTPPPVAPNAGGPRPTSPEAPIELPDTKPR